MKTTREVECKICVQLDYMTVFVGAPVFFLSGLLSLLAIYTNGFVNTYSEDRASNALELSGGGLAFGLLGKLVFILAVVLFVSVSLAWLKNANQRERVIISVSALAFFAVLAFIPSLPAPGSYSRIDNFFFVKQIQPSILGGTGESTSIAQWYTLNFRIVLLIALGLMLAMIEKTGLGLWKARLHRQ
jgi:hypothetical protein